MSARLELGDERYVVENGQVRPDGKDDDPVHKARAQYMSAAGPVWVDRAVHEHRIDSYDPDRDCTLARVIALHLHGRVQCDPPPPATPGRVF